MKPARVWAQVEVGWRGMVASWICWRNSNIVAKVNGRDPYVPTRHGIAGIWGELRRRRNFLSIEVRRSLHGALIMRIGFRWMSVAVAMALFTFSATAAWAGDDGAAPIWMGIGSIFGWGKGDTDPIEYRDRGKIVVPPKVDLPPPEPRSASNNPDWPVNQEVQRKREEKAAANKTIAGVGDARQRFTHPFDPNAPVTVRAVDPQGNTISCAGGACGSSILGNLNPLNWVGMGKHVPLGPEPDREWLTDPPKGFRAPVGPTTGQAAN